MTDSPSPTPAAGRPLVVVLFAQAEVARQAIGALDDLGLDRQRQLGLLVPGPPATAGQVPASDVSGLLAGANQAGDVATLLQTMGVADGEARYVAEEVRAGHSLVIANAGPNAEDVRRRLLARGGYDVQSRGGELARPSGAGVPGGSGPRPIDLTSAWPDVASRYRMLWQQHYGTTDATWEQVEPIYRYAWQRANAAQDRGRPWSEVAARLEEEWRAQPGAPAWSSVAGPLRDVWEDVADEAASGAEGGQDRRIARPGADQSGPAAAVVPPDQRVP